MAKAQLEAHIMCNIEVEAAGHSECLQEERFSIAASRYLN